LKTEGAASLSSEIAEPVSEEKFRPENIDETQAKMTSIAKEIDCSKRLYPTDSMFWSDL
jgi:hypothetical protein